MMNLLRNSATAERRNDDYPFESGRGLPHSGTLPRWSRAVQVASVLLGCVAWLCGCAMHRAPTEPVLAEPLRQAIQERTGERFDDAFFFKPAATSQTNSAAFKFAPLILQEVAESVTNGAVPKITKVFFYEGREKVRGRMRAQYTYWWFYDAATRSTAASGLPVQGLRITLDWDGEPTIWEVLGDTLGAEIVYVSEPLEDAAKAHFKRPRPGRCHVCERDEREAPRVVVAQLIPEGPTPMGPIIYLGAGTHDVTAITCRCMPDQADRLVGQGAYQLVEAGAANVFESQWTNRLENVLRLPREF